MVTPGDVLRWLVAVLIADSELTTWCRQTFGRPPLIQVGEEPDTDPQQWRLPAIVMLPERRAGGQSRSSQSVAVVIGLRARLERSTANGGPDSPIRQYDGVYAIDEFAALVVGAIERRLATTQVCLDPDIATLFDTEQLFPVLLAELRLTLTIPALIGADPTLE